MAELTRAEIEDIVDGELERRRETRGLPNKWKLEALAWMGGIVIGLAAIAAVGLGTWVTSIVRDKAEQIVTNEKESGFKTLRSSIVDAMSNKPEFRAQLANLALPKGAVLVVNHADGCQGNWVQDKSINGRFIVGVGGQEGLTAKGFLESGGAESHTLTIDEMPQHAHKPGEGKKDPRYMVHLQDPDVPNSIQQVSPDGPNRFQWGNPRQTAVAGGNSAHNNMPPFIALYFCKKKA